MYKDTVLWRRSTDGCTKYGIADRLVHPRYWYNCEVMVGYRELHCNALVLYRVDECGTLYHWCSVINPPM